MEQRTKTAQELTTNPILRAETGETKNVQGSVARTRVKTILYSCRGTTRGIIDLTILKHPGRERVKPLFVIFDTRTL